MPETTSTVPPSAPCSSALTSTVPTFTILPSAFNSTTPLLSTRLFASIIPSLFIALSNTPSKASAVKITFPPSAEISPAFFTASSLYSKF